MAEAPSPPSRGEALYQGPSVKLEKPSLDIPSSPANTDGFEEKNAFDQDRHLNDWKADVKVITGKYEEAMQKWCEYNAKRDQDKHLDPSEDEVLVISAKLPAAQGEQAYEAPGFTGTVLDKQEQTLFGTNYVFYDMGSGLYEDKALTQGRKNCGNGLRNRWRMASFTTHYKSAR